MTRFLLPPSIDEWLPQRHLARFVVEVIGGLDLTAMSKSYRGTGSASYHPAPLLGLLIYGYATGVFSSRKFERATHDSVAFRFIAANDHPDHDTIATFRRRFLPGIEALFVKVLLELAHQHPAPVEERLAEEGRMQVWRSHQLEIVNAVLERDAERARAALLAYLGWAQTYALKRFRP